MTEEEWLAAGDAYELFVKIMRDASPRKIRLLGCACVDWAWRWGLNEQAPEVVRVAEAFADGLVSEDDVIRTAEEVKAIRLECDEPYRPFPRTCELTELLASRRGYNEILEELHAFTADMFIVDDPEWNTVTSFVRDIFGNPFRPITLGPSWLTSTVTTLARQMYESRDFSAMPILADALQDAGCEDEQVLGHCRGEGVHVRGCFVVDLCLGRN